MAEVRTTSSTGGQKGTKLARFDLVPIGPLRELAEHYGIGASKYANHQWRRGYEFSKSYAALQRHLTDFWDGKDFDVCSNDPEGCSHVDTEGNPFVAVREDACFNHTGSHHLAAVAWHAFCLMEFKDRFPEHDDRYATFESAADEEARLLAEQERLDEAARRAEKTNEIIRALNAGEIQPYSDEDLERHAAWPDGAPPEDLTQEALTLHANQMWVIPEGYQNIGFLDESQEFTLQDLKPMQDRINRDVATLAALTEEPVVKWQDPEPLTLELKDVSTETMRIMLGLTTQARFQISEDGVNEDLEKPVTDEEAELLEKGYELLGEHDGKRIYVSPDARNPMLNLQGHRHRHYPKIEPPEGGWTEDFLEGYDQIHDQIYAPVVEQQARDEEWLHNLFAIRRDPAYDDAYLRDAERSVFQQVWADFDASQEPTFANLLNEYHNRG
jgi:hypothetical protein